MEIRNVCCLFIKFFKKKILLLLFIFYFNGIVVFYKKNKNIKVAICTIGKKENLYVKEFINYYVKLGIDKIFIYDDNEPYTEKFSSEIEPRYKDFVSIYKNTII